MTEIATCQYCCGPVRWTDRWTDAGGKIAHAECHRLAAQPERSPDESGVFRAVRAERVIAANFK